MDTVTESPAKEILAVCDELMPIKEKLERNLIYEKDTNAANSSVLGKKALKLLNSIQLAHPEFEEMKAQIEHASTVEYHKYMDTLTYPDYRNGSKTYYFRYVDSILTPIEGFLYICGRLEGY